MPRLPAIALGPRPNYDGHSPSSNNSSSDDGLSVRPRKGAKSHARKRSDDHIPRPPNAFILFRSDFVKNGIVPLSIEIHHQNLSRIAAALWRGMSAGDKQPWHTRAAEEKKLHAQQYPDYQFHPTDPYTLRNRRCVTKGRGAHDLHAASLRCADLANLLIEGTTGEALEKAVLELNKRVMSEKATAQAAMLQVTGRNSGAETRLSESKTSGCPTRPNPFDKTAANVNGFNKFSSGSVRFVPTLASPASASPTDKNDAMLPTKMSFLPSQLPSKVSGFGVAQSSVPPAPERSKLPPTFQCVLPSKIRSYGAPPVELSELSKNDVDGRLAFRGPARPGLAFRSHSDSDDDCDSDSD